MAQALAIYAMGRSRSILLFLVLTFSCSLDGEASESSCPTSCSLDGPEIRFPFRLTNQPERCGYPGFELTCRGNQTVLHLPASKLELNVESIIYDRQMLSIAEAPYCFMNLSLNLNLSNSPYMRYPSDLFGSYDSNLRSYSYTFVICSNSSDVFEQINCEGSIRPYFDVLSSDMDLKVVPKYCKPFKRVNSLYGRRAIEYYANALTLEWRIPGCSNCNWDTERCQFKNNRSIETMCVSRGPPYQPFNWQIFDPPYEHKGSSEKKVIAGVTVTILLVIVTTIAAIKIYVSWTSKRKKEAEHRLKVENFLKDYESLKPTRYTYAEIKKITNHLKSPLGQGGYGSVFKGNLPNSIQVAVKILKKSIEESEDFINEVGTIGRIHHVNVVRLLGFCADGYERALIYEFMPNESLEKFIFLEGSKRPSLGWEKLQGIAIGIARGIEYLHQGCDQRILHFDIKPHNILLDENFNPKITDFGLAKLCSKEQSIVSMSVAKGTMGYIAPEVISRSFGNVSYKSDVYSFGVLLLEMVGGRKHTNVNAEDTCRAYFPEWIYNQLHQGEGSKLEIIVEENPLISDKLREGIELEIVEEEDALIAKKLSIVALWCIQWYPVNRPSIQRVVQMLEGSIESLIMPPNPFGSTSQNDTPASLRKKSHCTELTVIVE